LFFFNIYGNAYIYILDECPLAPALGDFCTKAATNYKCTCLYAFMPREGRPPCDQCKRASKNISYPDATVTKGRCKRSTKNISYPDATVTNYKCTCLYAFMPLGGL
jgi:hypothetical protein